MHVQIKESIHSVLVVEDEMIVAMLVEDLVRELGVHDVHICSDVATALQLVETVSIDFAVLDLRLRDGTSMEIADALAERGIPFIFSSGSNAAALDKRHACRPMIGKPFHDDDFKLMILDTWTMMQPERAPGGQARARVATSGATD